MNRSKVTQILEDISSEEERKSKNIPKEKKSKAKKHFRIYISPAKISRIITKDNELLLFHREKADIFLAGLLSTDYQQIDDTSSRVHGGGPLYADRLQSLLHCVLHGSSQRPSYFPDPGKGKIRRTRIIEAAAIAAYVPPANGLSSSGRPFER